MRANEASSQVSLFFTSAWHLFHASERGVSLEHCAFYTDAYADLPLLEVVGRPFVVCPDPKLRREAERRGWPVLWWSGA